MGNEWRLVSIGTRIEFPRNKTFFSGRGNLARHHAFLWPAFGLVIALAVWRLVAGNRASIGAFKIYLATSVIAGALRGTAGYWGGELLLNG